MPSPAIILVSPQMGENIGAAARAMLNFELNDLRIVTPRDGWPNQKANEMSCGALDIIPSVQIFESFSSAISDLHFIYGTTARTRNMIKPVFTIKDAVSDGQKRSQNKQKIGFVFGSERNGLENEELSKCNATLHIPTNPAFSSLNLGQAVLLTSYELNKVHNNISSKTLNMGDSFPASHDKLDEFLMRLETELDKGAFFRDEELRPTMLRNIRNIFMRTELSDQELKTFHGIISSLIGKKKPKK
ncbi:MAG: RNA methyltransferase [Alphaproteobacteria bacterium]|nr:RNA methyltransferase [Alphaproteobacteria bacterium]